jgi:tRNA(fMet)-specific endonuclease VapC
MRNRPEAVLVRLEEAVTHQHRIVISAITYAELRFGASTCPPEARPSGTMTPPSPGMPWQPPAH